MVQLKIYRLKVIFSNDVAIYDIMIVKNDFGYKYFSIYLRDKALTSQNIRWLNKKKKNQIQNNWVTLYVKNMYCKDARNLDQILTTDVGTINYYKKSIAVIV